MYESLCLTDMWYHNSINKNARISGCPGSSNINYPDKYADDRGELSPAGFSFSCHVDITVCYGYSYI